MTARVLVVDDEEADRVNLAAILTGAGYEVLEATGAEEALDVFLAHPVHVVLTDIVMPMPDGLDLISSLTNVRPDVAVVAISGKSEAGLSIAGHMGAREIIRKPISAEDVLAAVAAALGG